MGRVSLDSTTGAQFVNLNGDALGWSASDQQLVDTVSGQFAQPGDVVNRNQLAECVTLFVDGLDSPARDDINTILNLMLEEAPSDEVRGYIIGALADLDTVNYARSLLNNPVVQAMLTPERVALIEQIMTAGSPAQQIALIINAYQQFADHPRTDYSEANAQVRLNSVTLTGDTFNPNLILIFDQQDADGLKAAIQQAQVDGTTDQLAADIRVFGTQGQYLLNELMADSEVGNFAFQVSQTMPATDGGASGAVQQDLNADLVRSLLTQPTASPAAIAHDYNTVAFRAHAVGQLVRNW